MQLSTMRRIDYYVGVVVCFALATVVRVLARLRPGRRVNGSRRVLFIELSEMGSTILASAAIRRLQAREPEAALYFLIFRKNAPSLRLLGLFAEERILTIRSDSLVDMALDVAAFVRRCHVERIDTVIDFELFSRVSSILSMLSGAIRRVGFHNYRGEGLYRGEHLTHRVNYNPYHHMAQNFMALIEALDCDPDEIPQPKRVIPVQPPPVRVEPDPEAASYVAGQLAACYPPLSAVTRVVLLNHDAGSLLPIRSWPVERFATLARRLLDSDPELIVVLMGIHEAEASARLIATSVGDPRCIDFVGRTRSLVDVIALFHQSDLLITNDSGPAHFATLTPVRSITLFGPETPVLYGTLGEHAVHLYAGLACSPCLSALNHRNSPCADNQCLKVIAVEEVFAHARRLLDTAPPRLHGAAPMVDASAARR